MDWKDIKKGVYIILKDEFPCILTKVLYAPMGKHGHSKKLCFGRDIITDLEHKQCIPQHSQYNYKRSSLEEQIQNRGKIHITRTKKDKPFIIPIVERKNYLITPTGI